MASVSIPVFSLDENYNFHAGEIAQVKKGRAAFSHDGRIIPPETRVRVNGIVLFNGNVAVSANFTRSAEGFKEGETVFLNTTSLEPLPN